MGRKRVNVNGLGRCEFYVYKKGTPRIRVKSPYWEDVFEREDGWWFSSDTKTEPLIGLALELEEAYQETLESKA